LDTLDIKGSTNSLPSKSPVVFTSTEGGLLKAAALHAANSANPVKSVDTNSNETRENGNPGAESKNPGKGAQPNEDTSPRSSAKAKKKP